MNKQILITLIDLFKSKWNYTICIGAEIEFYLDNLTNQREELFHQIIKMAAELNIPIDNIEEERGHHQYEIQFHHNCNPVILAENITIFRKELIILAEKHGVTASFKAKPHPKDYGSSLHIHINLLNPQGENLFPKADENSESKIMLYSIAGLLSSMKESMVFFAPLPESYTRFAPHFDAPVNLSWGGNNRTTSIRIPTSTKENRRIEHRVAGSDSDPFQVITAILIGIDHGLNEQILATDRIYGNADDHQYKLSPLPTNLVTAQKFFTNGKILKQYFEI